MSQPILSIMIPTVVGREGELGKLLKTLIDQIYDEWENGRQVFTEDGVFKALRLGDIEIVSCKDDKTMSIGEKREMLYQKSNGRYAWQIDDDDSVAHDAIELILEAIKQEPDCITFLENCMMNGAYKRSRHSLDYDKWRDNYDGYDYTRSPFYKNVIKTEIAKKVPFRRIRWNEDEQFSYDLLPHLKTEVHIPKEIYFYQYTSTDHNERYGFDK
jgi:hypothetical protein